MTAARTRLLLVGDDELLATHFGVALQHVLEWRGALERANSTEPIPRPWSPAPGSIAWIRKFAFVNRKTSASDALRKSCSETLKLGDPLIDPFGPFSRKARPVLAGGNMIGRKLGEFHTDFLERQPDPLREDNKGNTAKHRSGIAPMP